MAAACAILNYRKNGIRSFVGGSLVFADPSEKMQFEGVVARGMDEIQALLERYEVL